MGDHGGPEGGKCSHSKEPKIGQSSEPHGKELKYGESPHGKEPKIGSRPDCGDSSQDNGQPGPKAARRAGKSRGPRESRPEFGEPGGIYGPDGARLPAHVFYRASKRRYRARVRRVDGKHHRDLAAAIAEASALCVELT